MREINTNQIITTLVVRIITDVFMGHLKGVNQIWEYKEILPKDIMFKLKTER